MLTPLLTGALAGLAVAMPLGAIGVLLLNEGLRHGWRPAAAGALGVGVVDLVYAALAMVAGAAVAAGLAGHERSVRLVGAAAIGVIVVRGLWELRRPATTGADDRLPGRSPGRSFLRFLALTAINPVTVVYFTVLAAGLADRLPDAAAKAWFVVGVGAASIAWQLGLAAAGALLGARIGERLRTVLGVVGYAIAAVFGLALVWSALR